MVPLLWSQKSLQVMFINCGWHLPYKYIQMLYRCKPVGSHYLTFQGHFREKCYYCTATLIIDGMSIMLFWVLYIDLYTHTSSLCCMVLLRTSPTSFLGEVLFFFEAWQLDGHLATSLQSDILILMPPCNQALSLVKPVCTGTNINKVAEHYICKVGLLIWLPDHPLFVPIYIANECHITWMTLRCHSEFVELLHSEPKSHYVCFSSRLACPVPDSFFFFEW